MSHYDHDIDQELRELYRSRARGVDTNEFTDELGNRLARTRKRPGISRPVRVTALVAVALLVATGVGVGTLQAIQHLGGPTPTLVLGGPLEPGEGDSSSDPTTSSPTTVTTLAPEETGSDHAVEAPDPSDAQEPVPTDEARELADAVVERFPQLEVISAVETTEGNGEWTWRLIDIKLALTAASGGGTVAIQYFGPDQPMPTGADSTTTTVAPDLGPDMGLVVTHPEITGAVATYLVEYPGGARWQLMAQFSDAKEINVTSIAADTSSAVGTAPLDGDQIQEVVDLLVGMLY